MKEPAAARVLATLIGIGLIVFGPALWKRHREDRWLAHAFKAMRWHRKDGGL